MTLVYSTYRKGETILFESARGQKTETLNSEAGKPKPTSSWLRSTDNSRSIWAQENHA
jgi:hypothetical protein